MPASMNHEHGDSTRRPSSQHSEDSDLDVHEFLHDQDIFSSDDDENDNENNKRSHQLSSDNQYLLKPSHPGAPNGLRGRFSRPRPGFVSRFYAIVCAVTGSSPTNGKRRWLCGLLVLATLLSLVSLRRRTVTTNTVPGYSPPWYPSPAGGTAKRWEQSYEKAQDMVRKMTLTEKVNVTTGTGWMNGLCVGNTGPAVHVGFPSLCLQDGPLGIRYADNVTAGPSGITVGATWNRELMYKRGRMLGLEAKIKGVNVLLGPCVGPIGRTPLGGRNWEGFGSDPVLQAAGAVETIKGIQDEGIMATIKHFVGNEQEHFRQPHEWGIPTALSSNIGDRALHELYAWPFADSIRAGVASVMCSYNQVNNSFACQNSKLMNGILKDELGFQGFIQSDWLAKRGGVASALAGLDMDMPGDGEHWADGISFWGPELTMAALNGSLPLDRLDDAVTRIVASWYQLEQDDEYYWHRPPPEGDGGPTFSSWTNEQYGLIHAGSDDETVVLVNRWADAKNVGGFSHSSLSRRIAAEGIVLLRNDDDFLPLSRNGHSQSHPPVSPEDKIKIGVFGEDALANPDGPNSCPDRICNNYTLAMGWGSGTAEFPHLIAPLDALRSVLKQDTVELSLWSTNNPPAEADKDLLQNQDLCMVFVNADSGEGFGTVEDVHGDRVDLKLAHGGDKLIETVADNCGRRRANSENRVDGEPQKTHGDTVVVIHSVGAVDLESFIEHPHIKAVVWAGLPGEESGTSLVDVLFGDLNPSGHLPFTIGKSLKDYGPAAEILVHPTDAIPQQDFDEGVLIDYKWFDAHKIEPRFEFGFGLSYTTFEIRNLHVESTLDNPNDRPAATPGPRPAPECSPPDYSDRQPLDAADAVFPSGWRKLKNYIYPYIDSVNVVTPGAYPLPVNDGKEIPSPAGGSEGGHPELWTVLARATFDIENTGARSGQAVPQLYVVFPANVHDIGGDSIEFPPRQLRAFTKVHLAGSSESLAAQAVGESTTVTLELTRRDLSYWSVRRQNWVVPEGTFGIELGLSSRDVRARGSVF